MRLLKVGCNFLIFLIKCNGRVDQFCSFLQLGQSFLFSSQGITHLSWNICLHFSNLMTSPLMKPLMQIVHSFYVLPIFIFLIPSNPF